jgi:hypothetical protein
MWRRNSARREKRGEARRPVRWTGRCWSDAQPDHGTAPCAIVDVSPSGAAVTVVNEHGTVEGDAMVVEVDTIGSTPVSFRLHGVVRHVSNDDDTAARFGMRLTINNALEQRILRAMNAG